ncbi:MFS transporter [Bibersteinia trehalosi]|uniref:MFS transporter n=1 Tax=Bibersteinia trehalosi TaxID=47735 RepID=UPI001E40B352|nr:MFS transporter [Bibersteinia trehalosi]
MIFLQEKGLSMYEISILQMALNITMFLFEVPSGILSDKFGRKPPAFLGISFSIIYLIGMLYLNEFFYLVIIFIVYGIGISLLSGVDQSLIYEQLDYYGK